MRSNIALFIVVCIGALSWNTQAQMSFTESCFYTNERSPKVFLLEYFNGQSRVSDIDSFFNCLNSSIQFFLDHTTGGNSNYYTPREIKHFFMYMGFRKIRSQNMSYALFNIKHSLIGGHANTLTLQEIQTIRHILTTFRHRLKALHPLVPSVLNILKYKNSSQSQVITTSNQLAYHISALGQDLSRLPFYVNVEALKKLAQNINALGFSFRQFKSWNATVDLFIEWKKTFSPHYSSHIIQKQEWPSLLNSFSILMKVWLYYKRFLENRQFLSASSIPHTQHVLSGLLDFVDKSYNSVESITWGSIDSLAQKLWFVPSLSQPTFKLIVRSGLCFVLERLSTGESCRHKLKFSNDQSIVTAHFGDLAFELTKNKPVRVSFMGEPGGLLTRKHIQILRKYLQSWIQAEQTLIQSGNLPPVVFGNPRRWLKRNIQLTPDRRLLFHPAPQNQVLAPVNKQSNRQLMSYLNWQAHLMRFVTSSYSSHKNRGGFTQKMWQQLVHEWTPVVLALNPSTVWQDFQPQALSFFSQGDILTSQANGDGVLQEQEALELFSLFISAWKTFTTNKHKLTLCKKKPLSPRDQTVCLMNLFSQYRKDFFTSFPRMQSVLFENAWGKYSNTFKNFENPLDNLFVILMIIYHQENILEYRDKNNSHSLDIMELSPFVSVFYNVLKNNFAPFIYTKRDAFAFTTYLFHYGQSPISIGSTTASIKKDVVAPLRFADWIIRPEKWQQQTVSRKDILKVLIALYYYFP